MCTILFLYRVHPEFPLVVAANRDEFYTRPTSGPRLLLRSPRVLAGVDLRGGGTWMGANENGVVVGLTNQRTWRDPDPSARSRGEVVAAALAARSSAAIVELLGGLDARHYNAFNLLFGDADALFVAYARPGARSVEIVPAPEGVHVLPNDRLGAPGFPKADRARSLAEPIARAPWPVLRSGLAALLGDHERPPFEAIVEPPPGAVLDRRAVWHNEQICTHGDAYGTRSSTLVALRAGSVAHYEYADGPPCLTPFEAYAHLVSDAEPG